MMIKEPMRKLTIKIPILIILSLISNCRTFYVPTYYLSKRNIEYAKDLFSENKEKKISLGSFSENSIQSIDCSIDKIAVAGDFGEYIREGIKDELETAGVYSESGKIRISAKIIELKTLNFIIKGDWKVSMTIYINDKKSFIVHSSHTFHFYTSLQCPEYAQEFVKTSRDIISEIISSPELKKAIEETQ